MFQKISSQEWINTVFFRLILIYFNMTVYMWCVCYECRMFYHCIIKDLESVNKHLL